MTPNLTTASRLGTLQTEAGNKGAIRHQLQMTLALTGKSQGEIEPKKSNPHIRGRNLDDRLHLSQNPAESHPNNGKSKGFRWLNWLHLKERKDRKVIESEERRKTNPRSVGGRTYGRPDERINPLDSGRTKRNCFEEFRIHKLDREHD
jgi:hypothetical protein